MRLPDGAAVDKLSSDYQAARNDADQTGIRTHYSMGQDVPDPGCRLLEINNWLNFLQEKKSKKPQQPVPETQ